jgi:outer membrane protein OmpA-like peptidoglycan-associated protein
MRPAVPRQAFAVFAIAMSVALAVAPPLSREDRPQTIFLAASTVHDSSNHQVQSNSGMPPPPNGTMLLAIGLILSVLGNLAQSFMYQDGGTAAGKLKARIRGLQVSLMLEKMKASRDKSEVDALKAQLSREDMMRKEDERLKAQLKATLAEEENMLATEKKSILAEEKKLASQLKDLDKAQQAAQSARDSSRSAEVKRQQDELKKQQVDLKKQLDNIVKKQEELQRYKEVSVLQERELAKQRELHGKLEAEERRLVAHEAKLMTKQAQLSANSEKDRQTMADLQKQHALIRRQQEQIKKEREVSLKKQEDLKQMKELSTLQRERLQGLDNDRSQNIEKVLKRGNVHVDVNKQQIKLLKALPFKPILVTKDQKVAPPAVFEDPALANTILTDLAELLSYIRKAVVLVEGHTAGGTLAVSEIGFQIATERAELVVQTLKSKGVNPARLEYRGLPGTMGKNEFAVELVTLSWAFN